MSQSPAVVPSRPASSRKKKKRTRCELNVFLFVCFSVVVSFFLRGVFMSDQRWRSCCCTLSVIRMITLVQCVQETTFFQSVNCGLCVAKHLLTRIYGVESWRGVKDGKKSLTERSLCYNRQNNSCRTVPSTKKSRPEWNIPSSQGSTSNRKLPSFPVQNTWACMFVVMLFPEVNDELAFLPARVCLTSSSTRLPHR